MEEMTEAMSKKDLLYEYLTTPGVKIDYVYSNTSRMDSPFYYDFVKLSANSKDELMPIPLLISALGLSLPCDDELRSDPVERALEVAYALRECNFEFDMQTIISKKDFNRNLKK